MLGTHVQGSCALHCKELGEHIGGWNIVSYTLYQTILAVQLPTDSINWLSTGIHLVQINAILLYTHHLRTT